MTIIIANSARINAKYIKNGSVQGRYECVQKLEDKFYTRINQYKNRNKCTFDYIKNAYSYVLEGNKTVVTHPLNADTANYSGVWLAENPERKNGTRTILGYFVELLVNRKNEDFAGVSIDTLMHESDHLFSYLTNPKYIKRMLKVSEYENEKQSYEKFFVNNIQSPMKPEEFKTKLYHFIKIDTPDEIQIDVLQNFRYKLINEINAYNAGMKYTTKYRNLNPDKIYEPYYNQVEVLNLNEKLDIVTKLTETSIAETRKSAATS